MMAKNSAWLKVRFEMFVDRPAVVARLGKWKTAVLGRVGAFGRGVMKKQIRPALKGRKRDRTVTFIPEGAEVSVFKHGSHYSGTKTLGTFDPITAYVPADGSAVIDTKTGRPVNRWQARRARMELLKQNKNRGVGQPPRRGPTDKLRKFMFSSIDDKTDSVVIGPEKFPFQPQMENRASVPELLNRGGVERLPDWSQPGTFGAFVNVKYGKRPYVEKCLPPTYKKLKETIQRYPVESRL